MRVVIIDGSLSPESRGLQRLIDDVRTRIVQDGATPALVTLLSYDHMPTHPGTTLVNAVPPHEILRPVVELLTDRQTRVVLFACPIVNSLPGSLVVRLFEWLDWFENPRYSFEGKVAGFFCHFHECGAESAKNWTMNRCEHLGMGAAPHPFSIHQKGFAPNSEARWQMWQHQLVAHNAIKNARLTSGTHWGLKPLLDDEAAD